MPTKRSRSSFCDVCARCVSMRCVCVRCLCVRCMCVRCLCVRCMSLCVLSVCALCLSAMCLCALSLCALCLCALSLCALYLCALSLCALCLSLALSFSASWHLSWLGCDRGFGPVVLLLISKTAVQILPFSFISTPSLFLSPSTDRKNHLDKSCRITVRPKHQ